MNIKDAGELKLIEQIKKQIGSSDKLILPIGDDAAAFELQSPFQTLLTTDSQVKNVHFMMNSISPQDLGFKALSVNVSDIAAMAGIPKYAVVALGLEPNMSTEYVIDLYKGLKEAAKLYNVTLAGGDVTTSDTFFINITVLGQVEPNIIRTRSEAGAGELIYVTGTLGASSAGHQILKENLQVKDIDYLIKKHNKPVARINQARLASENGAKAMEDISDGLLTEIRHICDESKVGAIIEAKDIPVDNKIIEVAKEIGKSPLDFAISGGEDYEIVFTAPENAQLSLEKVFELENLPIYKIGKIVSGNSIKLIDDSENELNYEFGWEHLK